MQFYQNLTMKFRYLILSLIILLSFTIISCSEDEATGDDCSLCTLQTPGSDDCEIMICEDGSIQSNESSACIGEDVLMAGGARSEIVSALEGLGFFCSN